MTQSSGWYRSGHPSLEYPSVIHTTDPVRTWAGGWKDVPPPAERSACLRRLKSESGIGPRTSASKTYAWLAWRPGVDTTARRTLPRTSSGIEPDASMRNVPDPSWRRVRPGKSPGARRESRSHERRRPSGTTRPRRRNSRTARIHGGRGAASATSRPSPGPVPAWREGSHRGSARATWPETTISRAMDRASWSDHDAEPHPCGAPGSSEPPPPLRRSSYASSGGIGGIPSTSKVAGFPRMPRHRWIRAGSATPTSWRAASQTRFHRAGSRSPRRPW